MANVEKIEFESATLFTELINKGQLKRLLNVKSAPYPRYCFKVNDAVTEIVGSFVVHHQLKSDRSLDDCWEDFEKHVISAEEKPKCVVVRNVNAFKRIVAEGYGCFLKKTCVDQHKKKCYIFYENDRILAIKNEEDAAGKAKYEDKKASMLKENIDAQMSTMIKKAMEVQK